MMGFRALRGVACLVAILSTVVAAAPGGTSPIFAAQSSPQSRDPEAPIMDVASLMPPPQDFEEMSVSYTRAVPPPLPLVTAPPPPRPVATVQPAPGLPRPQLSPCVTTEEYNRAALGTGCSCTCDEFARLSSRGPVETRRCTVACSVAYYRCWAPRPTEADIASAINDLGPAGPVLMREAGGRDIVVTQIMTERAFEWEAAQRCEIR